MAQNSPRFWTFDPNVPPPRGLLTFNIVLIWIGLVAIALEVLFLPMLGILIPVPFVIWMDVFMVVMFLLFYFVMYRPMLYSMNYAREAMGEKSVLRTRKRAR